MNLIKEDQYSIAFKKYHYAFPFTKYVIPLPLIYPNNEWYVGEFASELLELIYPHAFIKSLDSKHLNDWTGYNGQNIILIKNFSLNNIQNAVLSCIQSWCGLKAFKITQGSESFYIRPEKIVISGFISIKNTFSNPNYRNYFYNQFKQYIVTRDFKFIFVG